MTDSNATELLGCQWCGKKPQLEFSEGRWHVSTYCGHDTDNLTYHNAFVIADTKEQAIAIWNTRTPEQAIAATLGAERESNWYRLFGTPGRAARTIADDCAGGPCRGCPGIKIEICGVGDYDVLLEWLCGRAVKR